MPQALQAGSLCHVVASAPSYAIPYQINQMPCSDSFLAVYGSLRRRSLAKQSFFVLRGLQFYGYGILTGLLLLQNGYPGVLEQSGQHPIAVVTSIADVGDFDRLPFRQRVDEPLGAGHRARIRLIKRYVG